MKTGCVIVSYNVPKIITRAVKSIKPYVDDVIVVDHSDIHNPAYKEADKLGVRVIHTGRNRGHGPGLDIGIRKLETDYVITMDSDAYIKDPDIIKRMKSKMNDDVYGVGYVIDRLGIDYLHPYFALISRKAYLRYSPYINHGAPCLDAMKSIHGKMKVINIKMDGVCHEHRATRERKR